MLIPKLICRSISVLSANSKSNYTHMSAITSISVQTRKLSILKYLVAREKNLTVGLKRGLVHVIKKSDPCII